MYNHEKRENLCNENVLVESHFVSVKLYNIDNILVISHEIALELGDILSLKLSLPGWLSSTFN